MTFYHDTKRLTIEITSATKTYEAKIGIMYPSDYGFATTPDYWTTNLNSYSSVAYQKDWLYLGLIEWLLSPYSGDSNHAWFVASTGVVGFSSYVTYTAAVRPSFYLLSSVNFAGGDGTASSPIRIN